MSGQQEVEVEGRRLRLTNLDKVLYPVPGFTKGEVINYYVQVARYLLPHLRQRPVTLKRYPGGVTGDFFYEKDAPRFTPEWVSTFQVPRRARGPDIRYVLINDLATLVWCANLANIEIHPFLHRAPYLDQPTWVVFDLDPGEGAEILDCAEVALLLRDLLRQLGLQCFTKTSGSKGLQTYVPLNTPATYRDTQPFAKAIAQYLAREHPKLVVTEMEKAQRKNRVFVDWSQNSDFKTTVGVYSLRAGRQHPFVSFPVSWKTLEAALAKRTHAGLYYQPGAAVEALEKSGDLFAAALELKQELPPAFVEQIEGARPARKSATGATDAYRAKRDFTRTPEPAPQVPRASRQGGRRRFVIQKHAASRLHYDFRLEMHGALKSWAVPKGLPFALNEQRLAMATEDHPLEYLDFEGGIPQGEYGGGTVMVWDIGTYELIEGNYYAGSLHVFLEGNKVSGEWMLSKDPGSDRNWKLTKVGKGLKALSPKKAEISALTGRTMAQISASGQRWHSDRKPA